MTSSSVWVCLSAPPLSGWPQVDPGLPDPFAPAPLQGLHRYYGPVRPCASHRYSSLDGTTTTGSPSRDQGANHTHFDWPSVSRRQVLLFRASAYDELAPPIHRAPPGQHAGRCLTSSTPHDALCSRGRVLPRFRCHHQHFDASAVVHTRSPSRRTPALLLAGLFAATLTTPALDRRSLRWFGISACTANPKGRPSSPAQHTS